MVGNTTFRIFVSYSHEDKNLFGRLTKFLQNRGHDVLCDRDIGVGRRFTDAIKGLIAHAHVFMPLITANAQKRPWVHQETGYAIDRVGRAELGGTNQISLNRKSHERIWNSGRQPDE